MSHLLYEEKKVGSGSWSGGALADLTQKGRSLHESLILTVHCAKGLAHADSFGASDPYCVVKWRAGVDALDPDLAVGDESGYSKREKKKALKLRTAARAKLQGSAVVLGKTTVEDETLEPVWLDAVFQVDLPEGGIHMGNDGAELRLEVYDKDKTDADDFMGQVVLKERALTHPSGIRVSRGLARKPETELKLKKQKLVQGTLEWTLGAKVKHATNGKLVVHIAYAEDLPQGEHSEMVDPFAQVWWRTTLGNYELAYETKVVQDNPDPMWKVRRRTGGGYVGMCGCGMWNGVEL